MRTIQIRYLKSCRQESAWGHSRRWVYIIKANHREIELARW